MEIYRSIEAVRALGRPVVTLGTFDGVHLGHLSILDKLKEIASGLNAQTLIITFDPHPRLVLQQDNKSLRFITSLQERIERLRLAGIDNLLILPFTTSLAALSSEGFVRKYIKGALNARAVVVGYDHHFGRRAEGNFHTLEELGRELDFSVHRVEAFYVGGEPVSSSRIRDCVSVGDVSEARQLLGYPYFVFGKVVEGNKVGRKIGFPTANIAPDDPHKLLPTMGVYAGTALVGGKRYKGMVNVGIRPTLNMDDLTIEMHLFDFNEDIYGMDIRICLQAWIREEIQFRGVEELSKQLSKDKITALSLLKDVSI